MAEKKSVKNSSTSRVKLAAVSGASSALVALFNMGISLFTRSIFIFYLGINAFGIQSLLAEFIGTLTIVELGFGSAIDFAFYKTLGTNDYSQQKAVLHVYRKVYLIVGTIILIIGLIAIPFLPYVLKDAISTPHIYEIYLIMLSGTCLNYFIRGKKPILEADQRQYIFAKNRFIYTLLPTIIQIFVVWKFQSFLLYVLVGFCFGIVSNFHLFFIAEKLYSHLNDIPLEKIEKSIQTKVVRNILAGFLGSILTRFALSADNMIIAMFLTVGFVGIYANYTLVNNSLACIAIILITTIQPGIGQAMYKWSHETFVITVRRLFFVRSVFANLYAGPAVFASTSFIVIWLGPEHTLGSIVPLGMAAIMWLGLTFGIGKDFVHIKGEQWRTQWITIVFLGGNIVLTLLFMGVVKMGVSGTILAQLITTSILAEIFYLQFAFKHIFKTSIIPLIPQFLKAIFLQFLSMIITFFILEPLTMPIAEVGFIFGISSPIISSIYIKLIVNTLISAIIPAIIILAFNYKTDEFAYSLTLLKNGIKQLKQGKLFAGL